MVILSQTYLPTDGIQRPLSGTQSSPRDYPFVNPAEECYVHNKTTAVTYMVPFRTAMEWTAFKSFATKNASIISVTCPECTPKTCADKTGLAAINDGFNCGKLLNDGCGGTLNCMDNCEVGEVCSNGAINSACDLGDISDCGGNNRVKGHCEIDNGCTPIIDFAIIDANKHGRMGCLLSGPYEHSNQACGSYQEAPNNYSIFIRGSNCFVGSTNGMGLTECSTYFLNDGPPGYNFYKVSDGEHFPYTSYFSTVNNSFVACSAGDGGGSGGCSSPCCNDDCWNTCRINNDENYCFDICCLEQQT